MLLGIDLWATQPPKVRLDWSVPKGDLPNKPDHYFSASQERWIWGLKQEDLASKMSREFLEGSENSRSGSVPTSISISPFVSKCHCASPDTSLALTWWASITISSLLGSQREESLVLQSLKDLWEDKWILLWVKAGDRGIERGFRVKSQVTLSLWKSVSLVEPQQHVVFWPLCWRAVTLYRKASWCESKYFIYHKACCFLNLKWKKKKHRIIE